MLKAFFLGLLLAIISVFLAVGYSFERVKIPTASMEPTIPADSYVVVDKLAYLFHVPEPGDILFLWRNEGNGHRERYVKRLIALGGQTIQIKNCSHAPPEGCGVFVDGQKLVGEAFDRPYYPRGRMGDEVWTVPEGHYFVLGDNSLNSLDSRYFGFVDQKDLIGKVQLLKNQGGQ